jgi:hypothetical protein
MRFDQPENGVVLDTSINDTPGVVASNNSNALIFMVGVGICFALNADFDIFTRLYLRE